MSLNKQMIMFIATMVIILLVGTFWLNMNNTKNFLQEQLQSHAQDTATSLGLSLSSLADPNDISSMETMINAVFDRGYYAHITLKDMDNITLYKRENTKSMEAVPDWFINAIKLEAPSAQALVQTGWIPVGTLDIASHTGYAYIELWKTVLNLLMWFSLAAILAILVVIYALKIMLKPLKDMEKQAEAIVKKEYLIQEDLPTTVEFRSVVAAMNAMVGKLKTVFERDANTAEKLQKMAYQDSVTELSNRRHFEMIIDSLLDPSEENKPGAILLVRVNELKQLNDQFGYLVGDKLMKALAQQLQTHLKHENSVFARLNGTELVAVIPGLQASLLKTPAEQIALSIIGILSDLQASKSPTSISVAYTEFEPGQSRGPLLANLDFAIEQADKAGKNEAYYYNTSSQPSSDSDQSLSIIERAINENRFVLFQQSAYATSRKVHSQELFIRLKDIDGSIRSAGYFMPAVERLNRTQQIDRIVIKLAIQHLQLNQDKKLAINLSKSIIEDDGFQTELLNDLRNNPSLCKHLAFELPERLITELKGKSWPLVSKLKQQGVHIGIDHFGSRLGNMGYLQDLHPDYIKLDAAFSKAIENDQQTRDYVSGLCELADSLDIDVIAMTVENEAQLKAFSELGVKYFQGFHFGAPSAL